MTREEIFRDYEAFVAKFERLAAKTTDECITPPEVYCAVIEWLDSEGLLNGRPIVRPFFPGGDYQNHDYPEGCIVVDNPPFSKSAEILRFYTENHIDFFLFPPKHPYFPKGCGNCEFKLSYDSNNEKCQACRAIQKCMERAQKLTKETVKEYKNGGKLETYAIIDKSTDDYKRIEKTAMDFAKRGEQVVITPKFDSPENCPDYDNIYGSLKGTKYYGKCPDFKVGNVWYEHEGFTGKNPKSSFRNMCNHGLKQSDRIIIEDCGLTDGYMYRSILSRVVRGENIKEVWIRKDKKIRVLYKAESQ